ncbi:MAG: ABC transporter ATP-binding protein [Gammaproteobacteria bacterium]|nr:ABC transporter ATP-binding protein [Gammaproteobacteria bacterium]|tara:strand:- start:6947 stop:7648 length:702 start_codon:yes stop_codon:yes gene_type:complete
MSNTPLLEVTNLSLKLNNADILSSITIASTDPGVTMVMGPNGAGKSLFLRCLHGLTTPTGGSIKIFGNTILGTSADQAMVFQKPVLLKRSVIENLKFAGPTKTQRKSIDNALSLARLQDKQHFPAKLLSGGEQQRLALSRALLREPKLLVLDEPTASLDPASVQIIEQVIQDFTRQGGKVIFVSHDIGQAKRLGSEIVFLHKGKVLEHGVASDFLNNPVSDEARAYLNGHIII